MKSRATDRFWECYTELPKQIKKQAREAYRQFENDPYYPSLHFKRVHSTRPIFSVRISKDYRALGIQQGDEVIWFWIGPHSTYEGLLKKMRKA